MAVLSVFYLKLHLCSRHLHPEMYERNGSKCRPETIGNIVVVVGYYYDYYDDYYYY